MGRVGYCPWARRMPGAARSAEAAASVPRAARRRMAAGVGSVIAAFPPCWDAPANARSAAGCLMPSPAAAARATSGAERKTAEDAMTTDRRAALLAAPALLLAAAAAGRARAQAPFPNRP